MDISQQILSDITVHMKYAKYLPEDQRREDWIQLVNRNRNMHIRKFPHLVDEINSVYDNFVITKKILPSMRSLQFSGKPIEITPSRIYNCGYLAVNDWRAFSEAMFLLLGGTGLGFSVQFHHIDKLPEIQKPTKTQRYLIADSIEGWADAVKMLTKAYFFGKRKPIFDFSDIRPKGARLITSGGKAPGPEPLKDCLHNIEKIFDRKSNGEKLTSLECHDLMCFIADAVLAGGIRRAALISLFSFDDEDMLTSKFGNWWELNPQRGRANNSAVILRNRIQESEFFELWEKIKESNAGEPGIYFTNDIEYGTNPCCEIALNDMQFCNLCEVNASDITDQDDLNLRVQAAAFIGTLQASYTDFHYLREGWKKATEKEALIGIGMTGIASGTVLSLNLKHAANVVKWENERVAKLININKAARTTCVKPSGTSSLVLGSSSGIHAWHDEFYIRRIRVGKNEAIYKYLFMYHPELIEDDYFKPAIQAIISIPQRAPLGAITRSESALDLLNRVKQVSKEWIKPGHRKGNNTHNVSATISIQPNEWEEVGNWMWENKEFYNGLSVLPADTGSYKQAPFESISEETYNEMFKHLENIDLNKVIEEDDMTDLSGELACAGGACEIV